MSESRNRGLRTALRAYLATTAVRAAEAPHRAGYARTPEATLRLAPVASLAMLLASCACTCDADALARGFATTGVDCGRSTTLVGTPDVLDCIEGAASRSEPFFGGWVRQGIDSEVRSYAVEDAGGAVWLFDYDGALAGSQGCAACRVGAARRRSCARPRASEARRR